MRVFESPHESIVIRNCSITERVFEGLTGRPDSAVITDGPTGRSLTGRELMDGVRSLAGGLAASGVKKGDVIALMAPNIPEFFIVFHGIAWAGAIVTTVNPTFTANELQHQLNDSGAIMLVTIGPFLALARQGIEGTNVRKIVVVGDSEEGATPLSDLMGHPQQRQAPVDPADDVVVLPYSSGTTGLPKGVELTHRNLAANVDQAQAASRLAPGETTPAFLPFFHIYGMEILLNVYVAMGGNIVTLPRFDLELFLRIIEERQCSRLYIVPPVAIALAKHPLVDQFDLSSVKLVLSGAAPMGAEVEQAVCARLGCDTTQGYGMTEMSPVSHIMPLGTTRAGSAGPALPNTRCRIVDPDSGTDLGPDDIGELWVQGPQVMKGYLNNPQATEESLDAEGWLRTGDIASIDADGYLFVHDRLKELIKFNAFAVPPAEVEAALLSHPDILDVGVIGVPDEEAGEIPMAFVVPRDGSEVTLETVQAHLETLLAHYKQVRRLRIVESIPKTASGKILRRVLRQETDASA